MTVSRDHAFYDDEERAAIAVDRAIVELRQGRPIRLYRESPAGQPALLAVALETAPPALQQALLAAAAEPDTGDAYEHEHEHEHEHRRAGSRRGREAAHDRLRLVISRQRAAALNLLAANDLAAGADAVALPVPAAAVPETSTDPVPAGLPPDRQLQCLALGIEPGDLTAIGARSASPVAAADPLQQAALRLAKRARLMPALLTLPWRPAFGQRFAPLAVGADAIDRYPRSQASALTRVSEAPVQLEASLDSRFVLYRGADGSEHVAVVVGSPDPAAPVPVRLHSSCLTGDLFASLRCDCGDQLRRAVARLAEGGGGVLLYLSQEGRDIGLANKLRAYGLQQNGHDTVSADALLGFDEDERRYDGAAAILHDLGIDRVRLLTNNPRKIDALAAHGIEVVERLALTGTITPFNERYLATKKRVGHLL